MKPLHRNLLFCILSVYLFFAVFSAMTLLPNCDEVWFTIPGYNLVENGFFGTSVLDETANFRQVRLDGINENTYWIMPIFPLVQGVWGKIVGFGAFQTRLVSVFFGFVALLSWFYLIKKLSGNYAVALTAVGVMAFDAQFVYFSGLGRMDMMTAAFGVCGLAVFSHLRETNFERALLASFALSVASFFTHPLGLMWIASLVILIAVLDFQKIKVRHFALAGIPFAIFGAFWAMYILQNPDLFFIQFGGNASDRWKFFQMPFAELWREINLRYLFNFGIGDGLNSAGRVKIFILLSYVFSIVGTLAVKSFRNQMLTKFLLIMALQEFFMLLVLDAMKQPYYIIHIVPTLIAILAVWMNWLWSNTRFFKPLVVAILFSVLAINLGTNALRFKRDAYHQNYLTIGNILNENVKANDLVMASSEFWFALDRKENLLDDYRLGFKTGKKADFIVMDAPRFQDWFQNLAATEPQTYQYIENLLRNDYEMIYEDNIYRLYKRKGK